MAALDAWFAALANRATTPARVLLWGDSRTEGEGAFAMVNRWQEKLAAGMRAAFPTAGVTTTAIHNYSPINVISTTVASLGDWSNKTVSSSPNNFGLGTKASILNAAGHGAMFSFTGTAFKIAYVKTNVASSFSYSVDGGTPIVVSWGAGSVADGQVVTVTGLTDAAHNVTVAWVSGSVYITGAHQFRTEYAKGLQFFDAGHSGTRSSTTYGAGRSYMTASTATVNPHLIVVNLMTNDYGGNVSPATYRTEMEANIAAWKAGCTTPPSIVLTLEWKRTGTFTYAYADYVQAARDIAAADPTVALFDLQAAFPVAPDNTLGYFRTDMVHETEAGQAKRAELLQALISPPSTTAPATKLRILRAGVTTSGAVTMRVLRAGVTTESSVLANAGAPVTVDSLENVVLSAEASSGAPIGYQWTQTAGPAVTLRPGPNVPRPEFTAPATDAGTEVRFSLVVTNADGTTSANTALAVVTVRPHVDWLWTGTKWVPELTDVSVP